MQFIFVWKISLKMKCLHFFSTDHVLTEYHHTNLKKMCDWRNLVLKLPWSPLCMSDLRVTERCEALCSVQQWLGSWRTMCFFFLWKTIVNAVKRSALSLPHCLYSFHTTGVIFLQTQYSSRFLFRGAFVLLAHVFNVSSWQLNSISYFTLLICVIHSSCLCSLFLNFNFSLSISLSLSPQHCNFL